jgi:hypothetical protein
MFSFTDSDSSDSDDFLAVRQEQSHPLLPVACHQYTLLDTVSSKAQAKKLVANHKFAYQTRRKQNTKINTYACKLHAHCMHRIQVVHTTDGIKVLESWHPSCNQGSGRHYHQRYAFSHMTKLSSHHQSFSQLHLFSPRMQGGKTRQQSRLFSLINTEAQRPRGYFPRWRR